MSEQTGTGHGSNGTGGDMMNNADLIKEVLGLRAQVAAQARDLDAQEKRLERVSKRAEAAVQFSTEPKLQQIAEAAERKLDATLRETIETRNHVDAVNESMKVLVATVIESAEQTGKAITIRGGTWVLLLLITIFLGSQLGIKVYEMNQGPDEVLVIPGGKRN